MQTNVIRYEADLYKVFKPSADISTIDKAALVAYVSFLKDKGNQPKTINNKLSFVSTMLKHMQDIGKLEVVPSIKWESVVRNGRVRWFTVKEEQALYDIALSRNPLGNDINVLLRDFMCLLFDTGMRPWAEAFNIQRSWVRTDDEGTLFIRVPVEYSKTKTAREIPATKRVTKLLEKYTEGLAPTDRLFRNLTRTYCRRYWDNDVKPTMGWGDDEVVYCVRHTFATRLIEKGADTRVIQELLGHSTIGQTARYAKVTKGAKTSSVALLN
jgi:site-specific recombinase XerD